MEKNSNTIPRKNFLASFAAGATAFGLASVSCLPLSAKATPVVAGAEKLDPADEWFNKLKGRKHSIVYDVTEPHEIFPFAWPRVFLITNEQTGTKPADCGVVVILRHNAIPYAMDSRVWEKYKFGEFFKADDPKTKRASTRNPFWQPQPGDFKIPGVDQEIKIGINQLQEDGVMFCVCGMAIQVLSPIVAESMKLKAEDVKKDWLGAVLPGVQVVPSGVWAAGRAQEHGCGYIKV